MVIPESIQKLTAEREALQKELAEKEKELAAIQRKEKALSAKIEQGWQGQVQKIFDVLK